MSMAFLERVFGQPGEKGAVIWKNRRFSYAWLRDRIEYWENEIQQNRLEPGVVTAIQSDFSPNAVSLFLSLLRYDCILVPLTPSAPTQTAELSRIAQVETDVYLDSADGVQITRTGREACHPLYTELRLREHPGLVLFSSGSAGIVKAAVHDLFNILSKFETPGRALRTIPFLLYDHIGGVNTMLHVLANGGCLVIVEDRSPDAVLEAVSRCQVEVLPTSPTFLNLILLSEAYQRHDLSSLKLITYGSEPMPESTLQRFNRLFPHIQMKQTYGLSEVGILHSKSRASDSLWVKVGGEGFESRVADGMLEIKAVSAMLGYLNAPSPFTEDGWLQTGDMVERDGDYIKILGRKSDIIIVGGEKVYPAEVESVIAECEKVAEVTVYPERNAILGQIVCAKVQLRGEEAPPFIAQIKQHCRQRLAPFKVPVKVMITSEHQYTARFKKQRSTSKVGPLPDCP
jgi:long-chain acyl-CoA synthetase